MSILIYQRLAYTYITAEFKELRPIHEKLKVFYKGYKIGKVLYLEPADNYCTTFMKIALHPVNLKLPNNVTATLRRDKKGDKKIDYIEIDYPNSPSLVYLKNGDNILGKTTLDLESYLASQETNSMDNLKSNLEKTITDLQDAINSFENLFNVLQEMVNENRADLKKSSNNLNKATANINKFTNKINNSIKQKELDDTMSNINITTRNILESTQKFYSISSDINKVTGEISTASPGAVDIITATSDTLENVNQILCGISNSLSKNFGGLRLLFGKTINKKCP